MMRAIGLMSGTSLDGIDAALIEIDGDGRHADWSLQAFATTPFTTAQRDAIHAGIVNGSAATLCRLNADLGEWLAEAALTVAAEAGVRLSDVNVIGSHGQTLWHAPPAGERGATLQLGCAATIAERTGCDVVSDFRARDMAAGGHGAPLVPWADRLLFAHEEHARVLINIGGMANLTWVPPRDTTADVLAFDTGPGNALIDAVVQIATDGTRMFDADGSIAAAQDVDEALLARLLTHPFFTAAPPRSTGREIFGRGYVDGILGDTTDRSAQAHQLVGTLTELTARSIAQSYDAWIRPRGVGEVVVTGGGARNGTLMKRLRTLLAPATVHTGDDVGIHSDAKEAVVFAALAWAHVERIPANVPAATGARGPRVLGSLTPAGLRHDASGHDYHETNGTDLI